MIRTFAFCTLFGVTTLYFLYNNMASSPSTAATVNERAAAPWTSKFAQWHSRSTPHPSPSKTIPNLTLKNLEFIILRNAQVETEGFTLAVFKDKNAVSASGKLLVLQEADYDGLVSLSKKITELPAAGGFRNTWRVQQPRTSQPIDRILIGESLAETGVQGFSKETRELKASVGENTELPDALFEFVGLILEARDGFVRGEEGELVQKMKDLVGEKL